MKLLVATEFAPDSPGGGPAVVRQMLRGFREQGNVVWWWACREEAAAGEGASIDGLQSAPIPGRLMPARILPRLKAQLLEKAWGPLAARNLEKTLAALSPDCIWVIPHNWSILPIHAALVHRRINRAPTQRWHTTVQDYPDVHGNAKRWGARCTMAMTRKQRELYAGATTRDATSKPMTDDLLRTTGASASQVLHQGLEKSDFEFLQTCAPPARNSKIRIAYAGTVLVEHEFSLFVEALGRIRAEGHDVSLEFWSAHTYRSKGWFRPEWMIEHGHKSQDSLVADLRTCHWGFIPMALTDEDPLYNRFSFPTKFITYLAAGLPVISMGHPSSSAMAMARGHDIGVQLATTDPAALKIQLEEAFEKDARQFRGALMQCAHDHFDAAKMRCTLWNCLQMGTAEGDPIR